MKYLLPILLCFLLNGCFGADNDHYKNVDAFKVEISTWNIVGKRIHTAKEVAALKGFKCRNKYCYKDVPGFPCNQRLRVSFDTSVSGVVQGYQVWEKDGELPSQCL